MAEEILGTFAANVASLKLIPGTGGACEITVNGDLVYSKKATGKYPEIQELREKIKAKLS